MDIHLLDIATFALALGSPIVGWYVKLQQDKLKEQDAEIETLKKDLAQHKLYAAETFTRKDDMKELRQDIKDMFRRLEEKIEEWGKP